MAILRETCPPAGTVRLPDNIPIVYCITDQSPLSSGNLSCRPIAGKFVSGLSGLSPGISGRWIKSDRFAFAKRSLYYISSVYPAFPQGAFRRGITTSHL